MLTSPPPQQVPIVAALHIQGTRARLVIAHTSAGAPVVKSTQTFDANDPGAVGAAIDAAGVDLVVRVLPSASTIVRSPAFSPAPGSTDAQLLGALSLLAESELPANLPEHRRAAGIFPGSQDRAAALVAGWPSADSPDGARRAFDAPEVFTPEVAALAAFAKAAGIERGAAYLDRHLATVCIVAHAQNKSLARVTRIGSGGSGGGSQEGDSVSATSAAAIILAESLKSLGDTQPVDGASNSRELLLCPRPAGALRAAGMSLTAEIADQYAVALGAILVAADSQPAVRSLAALHEREPRGRATIIERAVRALSSPGRAAIVLLACLAILLAAPFAVAYVRLNTLQKAAAGDTGLSDRISAGESELAFARLLREKRWPMTKLLADIAGATPVGVQLDSLELAQEAGTLSLRAVAERSELITAFRENLTKTKVFSQVTTPSIGSAAPAGDANAGVQFQLTAKIAPGAAVYSAPPIEDFASRPLVARLYAGTSLGARGADRPVASRPGRASSTRSSAATSTSTSTRASTATSASTMSSRTGEKKAPVIPPPLSDDDIAKLDHNKAMLAWAQRKSAAAQQGISDEDKQRLQSESEKAKRRMNELKDQKASSAGDSK